MGNSYWEYAQRKDGEYPEHTSRGGKWLIFVSSHNLDAVWSKIKVAVEEGRLGGMAKASKRNSHSLPVRVRAQTSQNSNYKVICVYTYDWKDHQDVQRVREELRKLGIVRKISYKTDEDTEKGIYRTNKSEKISKYYE